ncbi:A disintegrin and metalloproteinase with thrombospondin motifs 9-like [Tubulanus polymorphus]|uniref:A disintegrin and metalloproteinase with thrombospondin motifs 9-like n=1 Tax=Tubulanus polymorphus TaxID=672921 RepID=UPI003DA2C12E
MKTTSLILTFLGAVVHTAWCCSLPTTCAEASATKPGDYKVYLGPKFTPVTVFCNDGKEYITLKAKNFGDNICERNWPQCGRTEWTKIRLDPKTMTVIGTDYTYSTSTTNVKVPYGQGGGCKGKGAVSGTFALDLTGTPFSFDASKVKWKADGFHPASVASVNKDDPKKASGQCGGDCGYCNPIGNIALIV